MRASVLAVLIVAACNRGTTPTVSAPTEAAAPKAARAVRVTVVAGSVTRTRADGTRTSIQVGDALAADDVLATTNGGTARLDVGGVADVDVTDATEVAIGELSETLSKVRLRDGRIVAVVHGEKQRSLQVDVPGASATASSTDGEFSMLATGAQLSVATKSGQVSLSARGRSVRIGAGQLSLVDGDHGPTPPHALPASLFLKLGANRPITQREKKTIVRGNTAPGAIVSINGVTISADPQGEFAAVVPLREGTNVLKVESRDAVGRTQRVDGPRITVDSRAPDTRTKVEW